MLTTSSRIGALRQELRPRIQTRRVGIRARRSQYRNELGRRGYEPMKGMSRERSYVETRNPITWRTRKEYVPGLELERRHMLKRNRRERRAAGKWIRGRLERSWGSTADARVRQGRAGKYMIREAIKARRMKIAGRTGAGLVLVGAAAMWATKNQKARRKRRAA